MSQRYVTGNNDHTVSSLFSLASKDIPIQFKKLASSVEGHSCSVVLPCHQLTTQREQPLHVHVGLWGWSCQEILSKSGKTLSPSRTWGCSQHSAELCRAALHGSAAAQSWHLLHLQSAQHLTRNNKVTTCIDGRRHAIYDLLAASNTQGYACFFFTFSNGNLLIIT